MSVLLRHALRRPMPDEPFAQRGRLRWRVVTRNRTCPRCWRI